MICLRRDDNICLYERRMLSLMKMITFLCKFGSDEIFNVGIKLGFLLSVRHFLFSMEHNNPCKHYA